MSKHTPGPWITDDYSKNDVARHVMNGNGNGPVYIARVPLQSAAGMRTNAYSAQEANARLIAAAPDLLEALRAADWYIGQLEPFVYGPDDDGIHEERAKVKAAIAKATGEQA